jgi:hypothetical protein
MEGFGRGARAMDSSRPYLHIVLRLKYGGHSILRHIPRGGELALIAEAFEKGSRVSITPRRRRCTSTPRHSSAS